jgi:hypothetical protein
MAPRSGAGFRSAKVARPRAVAHDARVLVVYLAPAGQIVLLLTLAVALYLTVVELRELSPQLHWKWWAWWLSLVFLTHFVGYLALRGYSAYRRWQRARA